MTTRRGEGGATVYRSIVRPLLFRLDAERAHRLAIALGAAVGRLPFFAALARRRQPAPHPALRTALAGLSLDSPILLGAGFDKNGRALALLSTLGFGALEVGAVSSRPCAGNAGCRAVRLVEERAVLTRYGVPNEGAARVARRCARHAAQGAQVPVGLNVIWNSANKPDAPVHEVVAEMAEAFAAFDGGSVAYATLNFACPNIRGEGHFDDLRHVRLLLEALDARRPAVPVFLKFRHRAQAQWMDGLVAASGAFPWIRGFIPMAHEMRPMGRGSDAGAGLRGSLSGAPLKASTLGLMRLWAPRIDPRRHVLVATGGLSSAQDVFDAMAAGATAVQVLTTLVYDGPWAVHRMNAQLVGLMQAHGLPTTAALTGSARTDRLAA